jgi:hypothetical protein
MIFLSAMLSIVETFALNAVCAAAASPAAIAVFTFLIAVRSVVRRPMLEARCLFACLARFAACLELAMSYSWCLIAEAATGFKNEA